MMRDMSRLQAPRVAVAGAVLADGTAEQARPVTLLVEEDRVAGLWVDGDGPDPGDLDAPLIDGSGSAIVPGMVDSHAHLSMPGGAQWIERGRVDATAELLTVGEENGEAMVRAGIRWARDVGAPRRPDADGRERALSLVLRDRWAGSPDRPYVRAAGTWIGLDGALPPGLAIEVQHGADLGAAVMQQLDEGADLIKLYLDGPDAETAPFTVDEVRSAVALAHERGARVAAHSGVLPGARVGAEAAVDSIEHGFVLDTDAAATLARNGVILVSTLAVLHSWQTFRTTSHIDRFTSEAGIAKIAERRARAEESMRIARAAGVTLAAGSDFGGGSLRANQLAWEVQAMVAAGIEPHVALAAATWRGGELYGDPDAGRLRVGGPAHFSLVHGDPLTDPSALWRVWLTR
jgi:imidazolonepropionase-like amidohydrolase